MKTVYQKIIELLDSAGTAYEVYEHEPVHTSEEAAKIRETSLAMGAKALVWYADKKPILVVVPGDKRLNTNTFKSLFGVKNLRFATPEEVTQLTTLLIGSIPPIGKALGLKSYFDESIAEKESVAFNAGSHSISIVMAGRDLVNVEEPELANLI